MALNDPTTTYGWDLPTDGGSNDTWADGVAGLDLVLADLVGAITSVDEVIAALRAALVVAEASVVTDQARIAAFDAQNQPAYARAVSTIIPSVVKDTATILSWSSAPVNVGTLWASGSPTRMTIPVDLDGVYDVRAVVEVQRYAGTGDNARRWEIRLLKNGAEIASSQVPYLNDGSDLVGEQMIMVEALLEGGVGDYFEVEVYWNEFEEAGTTALANPSATGFKTFFEVSRFPSPVVSASWEPYTSFIPIGMWGGTMFGGTIASTFGFTSGNAHYTPFIPSEDMTIDEMAMRVDLQDASDQGTARLGIYAVVSDTDHRPGALLASTGDIATGEIDATFEVALLASVALTKGTIYWLACLWKVGVGGALDVYSVGDARFMPSLGQGSFATGNDTGDTGIKATPGTGWSTLPDPADLTSEQFSSNLTAMVLHRSA